MSSSEFSHPTYVFKRKVFEAFGQRYTVFDPQGNPVFHAKMKAFKLKEDIRLYCDEGLTQEALTIKARQMIDFSAAYDVFDPDTQQRLGALRRKGLKSMLRDQWEVLNYDDQVIGTIDEDSLGMALVRRIIFSYLPQRYHATVGDRMVWKFHRHLSFFIMKLTLEILPEAGVDPRLALAAAILLCAVEGSQR